MDRRAFVVVAAGNLLMTRVIWAQESAKRYRLGIISTGSNPRSAAFYAAFEERLRGLGWMDGKNLTIGHQGQGTSKSCTQTTA